MWEGVRKENLNILFSDAIYRIHIRCIWSRDCSVRPRLTYFSFITDRHSTNGAGGRIGPQTNRDDGRNPPVRGKIIQKLYFKNSSVYKKHGYLIFLSGSGCSNVG